MMLLRINLEIWNFQDFGGTRLSLWLGITARWLRACVRWITGSRHFIEKLLHQVQVDRLKSGTIKRMGQTGIGAIRAVTWRDVHHGIWRGPLDPA